jgi:hypothetical protein
LDFREETRGLILPISLADRELKWTAFQEDPAWHRVREESEHDAPIVATIRNQILTPTPFSALK